MAIYLDTNVMYGWRTFAELDRLALATLAHQLGQEIVVPTLVAEELEGHMRRRLEDAAADFDDASSEVERLFELEYVLTEPGLDVDTVISRWRVALGDAFGSCEVAADDALAGLRREIAGTPPARRVSSKKPGIGGRDAAIWLAVVRDHARRDEPGHLVTHDGGFWDGDRMKPRLADDVPAGVEPLTLYKDVEKLLIGLGERDDDVEVDPEEVSARALPLIEAGLQESASLARSVFDRDFQTFEFRTDVTTGTLERVHRTRRFQGDFGEILLVDAVWKLDFRLLYRRPGEMDDDDLWFVADELDATGRVQVYLAKQGEELSGQFIAAQLKPRQSIWLHGDKSTMRSTRED